MTWDAVFCMRDLLRELPERLMEGTGPLEPEAFIAMMRSSYASDRDVRLYPARRARVRRFQRSYIRLMQRAAACAAAGWRRPCGRRRIDRPC